MSNKNIECFTKNGGNGKYITCKNSKTNEQLRKKPMKEVKPKPVKEVKPKPVKEVKPKPVKEVKPKPMKEVKPKPMKEIKPKPMKEIKPETMKAEPMKAEKVEPMKDLNKYYKTINNFNNVLKFMKSPSKRNYNYLQGLDLSNKELDDIFFSKKLNDFYPTPLKCFEEISDSLEQANNILDPTCGLGFSLLYLRLLSKNSKVEGFEYYKYVVDIGNKLLKDTDLIIKHKDFFDIPNKNKYDYIFLNPPFTQENKKKYYIKFLIKLFMMIDKSENSIEASFICPKNIIKYELKKGDIFDALELFDNISKKELKGYLDDFKINSDDLADIIPPMAQYIGECKFQTTKFTIIHLQFSKLVY